MKNWRSLCPGHLASKRIVEFQIPMLIQIYILNNSRPWVWGLLSFGGDGELLERLHHNKDGQKKGKDFSIHGVKPPIFDFALITHGTVMIMLSSCDIPDT